MAQSDPLAGAKAFLEQTERTTAAAPRGQAMSLSSPIGTRKPKRPARAGDIRLYAPGEQDQPTSVKEQIGLRKRLMSRRNGSRRNGSRRA